MRRDLFREKRAGCGWRREGAIQGETREVLIWGVVHPTTHAEKPGRNVKVVQKSCAPFIYNQSYSRFLLFFGLRLTFCNMFSKFLTRHLGIAVVRRLFKMGPKMVERRLKTVRRLFHPLLVEMCAMLKNSATLIVPAPRQEVCDAYLRRRQFFGARSAEIF